MGFSLVTAEMLFFIAVVIMSASLIALFGNYVDQTRGAMSDKQQYLVGQLRTDIAITNIDNSSGHLHVYVKNVGNQQLKMSCMNLFIDEGYVNLAANEVKDPVDSSAVEYLSTEKSVKLTPATTTYSNAKSVHEAKVVTCNAVWASENF
jgi:archaellum component FlaG (FlaF/FlaG flagellin family)